MRTHTDPNSSGLHMIVSANRYLHRTVLYDLLYILCNKKKKKKSQHFASGKKACPGIAGLWSIISCKGWIRSANHMTGKHWFRHTHPFTLSVVYSERGAWVNLHSPSALTARWHWIEWQIHSTASLSACPSLQISLSLLCFTHSPANKEKCLNTKMSLLCDKALAICIYTCTCIWYVFLETLILERVW